MTRRLRRSAPSAAYLKPGALAILRDTRIRSRQTYLVRALPNTPSSPSRLAAIHINAPPSFSPRRIYGPRFPQRKKLVAAKFVSFLNPPMSPGIDVDSSRIEGVFSTGGGDAIAAH